jgi:alkanesulfonate monooxygenase SsuD/methylene tetrahydromethanopterin reductase-like flavin-dependent oxidoreductase (luciferase family)
MRFGAALWVERTGWPELREAVLRAEAAGFDDLWIDDHLLSDEGDWRDPKLEGWTTLAAVAAITTRPRLGLLVSANTLRNPGLTAKMATTIDHVSGGRAILGIGAGWFEREHEAFGFEFGAGVGERLDRLVEAVPLMRRLLDGEQVGGSGPKKTLPLVARHADLWNAYGTPDEVAAADAILREACEAAGRDPTNIERTVNVNVVIRRDREDAERAWSVWLDAGMPQEGEEDLTAGGSLDDVAARLAEYRDVGFEHPILVLRPPFDLETVDRLPELRARLDAG